jgi:hypothetical protein
LLLSADEKLNDQDVKIFELLSVVGPDAPKVSVLALEFQKLMRQKEI